MNQRTWPYAAVALILYLVAFAWLFIMANKDPICKAKITNPSVSKVCDTSDQPWWR